MPLGAGIFQFGSGGWWSLPAMQPTGSEMQTQTLGLRAGGFYNTQSWKHDENLIFFVPNRAGHLCTLPTHQPLSEQKAAITSRSTHFIFFSFFSPSLSKIMEYDIKICLLPAPWTWYLSCSVLGHVGFIRCNKCQPRDGWGCSSCSPALALRMESRILLQVRDVLLAFCNYWNK